MRRKIGGMIDKRKEMGGQQQHFYMIPFSFSSQLLLSSRLLVVAGFLADYCDYSAAALIVSRSG